MLKSGLIFTFFMIFTCQIWADDHPTLAIGAKAPNFRLKGIDNKMYTLQSFATAKVLVVLFTCNHCPTAQAYEDRIIKFVNTYKNKGVRLVAINPNSAKSVRFDELGYSELNDSFAEMKIRAKDKAYNFTYLYDGDDQKVANQYGPVATPHVFVFDKKRELKYTGRIDDNERIGSETTHELADAVEAVLKGEKPALETTKTFGCSVKWLSKADSKLAEVQSWATEPVSLEKANPQKLKEIMSNKGTGKYRLINIWATWCGPCVAEFPSLVETMHMYRNRDFEFVTISADAPKIEEKVLKFLKAKYASSTNYIYDGGSKYEMIEAIDPKWQGGLPYTLLIAPNGEIVHRQMGFIDILKLRKAVVEKLGRYFD